MERVTNGWFGSLELGRMWGEDATAIGESVSITVECVTWLEMKMIDSIGAWEEDRNLIPYREWKNLIMKASSSYYLERVMCIYTITRRVCYIILK